MAAPTLSKAGAGSSKSTLNGGLTVTLSPNSFSAGDYICVVYATDPTGVGVTIAQSGGTATIGSFVTVNDVSSGSGTSGVRLIMAYAPVTASGTITGISATLASGTNPRALEAFRVQNADATTPIYAHQGSSPGSVFMSSPSAADFVMLTANGIEAAGSAAVTGAAPTPAGTGWTLDFQDATSTGTTGASGASNISVCGQCYEHAAQALSSVNPTQSAASGTQMQIAAIWQASLGGAGPSNCWDTMGVPI